MNVSRDWNVEFSGNPSQDLATRFKANPTERFVRCAIRLVVGGFKDPGDPQRRADLLKVSSDLENELLGFDHARTQDEDRPVAPKPGVTNLELPRHENRIPTTGLATLHDAVRPALYEP